MSLKISKDNDKKKKKPKRKADIFARIKESIAGKLKLRRDKNADTAKKIKSGEYE